MQSTIIKNEIDKARSKQGRTIVLRYDVIFKSVFMKNKDVLLKLIKDLFD